VTDDLAAWQRRARALLRPEVYAFYAGGAGREVTLRANEKAWRRVPLLPRVLRDVSAADISVRMLGSELATPVAVAPTAFHCLAHADGEVASGTGAARAGSLFVLSTRSTRRIEDVAAAIRGAGGAWWFQVYVMRDRSLTAGLVRRAAAAGAGALVLTVDTPEPGRKRKNRGDGLIAKPDFLVNLGPETDLAMTEQAADVTFADIGWLRELSGGLPVLVKGVLRADDAAACAAHGAAGVIVSNHGGRQLDGAIPAAEALPAVAAALRGSPAEVYVDGGIRTGYDVLAALALGARAVFVGRPVLWALASGGTEGVRTLLSSLASGFAHAMALAGAATVADLEGVAGPALPPRAGSAVPLDGMAPQRWPGRLPGNTVGE
jgi:4-hydroxymandelate oxidase